MGAANDSAVLMLVSLSIFHLPSGSQIAYLAIIHFPGGIQRHNVSSHRPNVIKEKDRMLAKIIEQMWCLFIQQHSEECQGKVELSSLAEAL